MGIKAVFFDRDGTLIVDKHYLHDPDQVEYLPDAFEALALIQEKGYRLFMVTNQSGIGRGFFEQKDMELVHERILSDLKKQGITMEDVAFCPHAPDDGCKCRKPNPSMITSLMKKHGITEGFMIGDKTIDAEAGIAAGIEGVHLTEGESEYPHVRTLMEFAQNLS